MEGTKPAGGKSEVDIAYAILKEARQPMYYKTLITQVLAAQNGNTPPAHRIAEVHTQINMDSRFVYSGKGMWGLSEWMPQRGTARPAEPGNAGDSAVRRERVLLEEIQETFMEGDDCESDDA